MKGVLPEPNKQKNNVYSDLVSSEQTESYLYIRTIY